MANATKEEFYEVIFSQEMRDKVQDLEFATNLYRALCNMRWKKKDTGEVYSCSWRYAGGLVATIRSRNEDYMSFYCSGDEGAVTSEIEEIFNRYGWEKHPWNEGE